MDELLGVPEVAEILGVTRQRVHQLKADNKLPPPDWVKGRQWMWTRSTVETYAKARNERNQNG